MQKNNKNLACDDCPVARATSVIGDKWNVLIIRNLIYGQASCRFDDFLTHLSIARNILSCRLDYLLEQGILEKKQYEEKPPRYVYQLTEKGLALTPILEQMAIWSEKWAKIPK